METRLCPNCKIIVKKLPTGGEVDVFVCYHCGLEQYTKDGQVKTIKWQAVKNRNING